MNTQNLKLCQTKYTKFKIKTQKKDRSNPILDSICSSTLGLIIQSTAYSALAIRSKPIA